MTASTVAEPKTSASYLYGPGDGSEHEIVGVIVFGGTAESARRHACALAGAKGMLLGRAKPGAWQPGGRAYRAYSAAAVG